MSALTPLIGLPGYVSTVGAIQEEKVVAAVAGTGFLTHLVVGAQWEYVLAVSASYASDASVATRRPVLQLLDANGDVFMESPANNGQPASTTANYYWYPGISAPYGALGGLQVSPYPQLVLPSGYTLRLFAQAAVVTDTFGPMHLHVLEMPTGPISGQ